MTASDAAKARTCKRIAVGRRVITLRPASLYSIDELCDVDVLVDQVRKQAESVPVSLWLIIGHLWHPEYRVLRSLLQDAVELMTGARLWRFSRLSHVLSEALEYLGETTKKSNKESDEKPDIALAVASLQRFYGGDPRSWYSMPQYQLEALSDAANELVSDADKTDSNSETIDQERFAALAHEMGMNGVYDHA